ncbi:hypothetical protein GCM10027294_26030 [Marinactinospora endophytica]
MEILAALVPDLTRDGTAYTVAAVTTALWWLAGWLRSRRDSDSV